jgi:transcriptional regulator with XRE-family HTH domain
METKASTMKINVLHISKGLRGLRLSRKYTLEDLSCYTNKDVGYLSRVENGKNIPKIKTLSDILSFYDMSIKEFYENLDKYI